MREIKDLNLIKALKKVDPELGKIILIKDEGYFWIASDDPVWSERISHFYFNDIPVNNYNQMNTKEWVKEIIRVLIQDRYEVFEEMQPWQVDLKMKAIDAGY